MGRKRSERATLEATTAVASVVGFIFLFGIACDPAERDRQAEARKLQTSREQAANEMEMARMNRAQPRASAQEAAVPHTPAFVDALAQIALDPTKAKASDTQQDDNLYIGVYAIPGFDRAEFRRIPHHPEAWSWALEGAKVTANEFGPPGSVRDLLANLPDAKYEVPGFELAGLLHRIEAGPLAGAILVYSPTSPTPSFQLSTLAYYQRTPSEIMMMGPLCEGGIVEMCPHSGKAASGTGASPPSHAKHASR
jgi:hypothetical protein